MLDQDGITGDPTPCVLSELWGILKRFAGEPRPGALEELFATIDRSLIENMNPIATK